jgi:hypothetical protein
MMVWLAIEATPQIGTNAMTIRIAGLNTNMSPAGFEWCGRTKVEKPPPCRVVLVCAARRNR